MLTVEQKADCKTNLYHFIKAVYYEMHKKKFLESWHHVTLCDYLERVLIGDIKRLIINMPPRYSKTEIAVCNFIAWSLGIYPDSEFVHVSYSQKLATSNTYKVRNIINSDVYKSIFKNVKIKTDSKAKDNFKTTADGAVYAVGLSGTVTGYGAGKKRDDFGGAIIIDDPHKATEIHSKVMRDNVIDFYQDTLQTRRNSNNTPIIVIMQRLHVDDLSGFLLNGGTGEEWEHLCMPAIDENNKPLWETMHSLEKLELIKKHSSYVWQSQYMQEPQVISGNIFKLEWWQYYKEIPPLDFRIITADTAQKTKEHNDYSVFQCWGYLNNKIYLIDQIRGKWESPELRRAFIAFWNKHDNIQNGALRSAYVEDKSSGTGLIQDIRRDEGIPIIAVPRTVDKVTRAMDCIGYIESGYVFLPSSADWLNDYLTEFSNFSAEGMHKHDDQIDPTLDAISLILRRVNDNYITW